MQLTTSEKIKILLERRNKTVTSLAVDLKTSRQNLTNKLVKNNFKEKDLEDIAKALDCEYSSTFKMNDTGEVI